MDDTHPRRPRRRLGARLLAQGWMAATAESCTGGWIAKTLTDIAGSSAWFDRGFVTYTTRRSRTCSACVPTRWRRTVR